MDRAGPDYEVKRRRGLIGHTDNTGRERVNADFGDWRARSVKKALEDMLKEDILKGRIRIEILVEPSPGASTPTADNRTREGRALNRRVEVFVAPPVPPPQPEKKITLTVPEVPPKPIIETKPGIFQQPVPTLPPRKSFKQWVDEWLRDRYLDQAE
jgi:hypothetical protein